uniref:Uncharacterized protein n=1 Tax=Arundo donax TaxID=35708 RepID=A0A0A9CGP1_ARUDO
MLAVGLDVGMETFFSLAPTVSLRRGGLLPPKPGIKSSNPVDAAAGSGFLFSSTSSLASDFFPNPASRSSYAGGAAWLPPNTSSYRADELFTPGTPSKMSSS